ncbi:MAG: tRNA (adenosine(37)-N6)-threonylcarbamoyltransferase complex dimerization subunit type 1 TsaB [Anaerocolumna aminovalerica]|jgi:tRNA threonylcarbamoyladenosine biosynthesis protein TsaB|uniref:tRNA (adenosine(37)-N6)-threonylcarbamoyltransferase complex dimerization subunit type 1 TsaB n=1 Tax=Anaerocolumna aminovalerica TaxID=1527 RepID=UPI00248B17F5|nr:tRNA (adenosine(37)-N6)-threonylcarbamoyltransferase complex dimerization subunit type 1 TsaB [Anaerocolumna aminovalerica]MDU6266697.1 tRNA (adenosine(37)-N6)-threonylcarbamoyltransferase complex dimerization subunit type 1 TsaB [Anaerocolumna aminovalerica]
MKILALDSSGLVASVAVVSEEQLLAEYTINHKKTHSQTLLPMLDEIVKMIELDIKDIDAIAVAAGPGSFTGLRIGSSTAKGLGLALNKPIIPVPTLEGMAFNLFGTDKLICPIMDARRNQVYTGLYAFKNTEFVSVEPQQAIGIDEIAEKINGIGRAVIFLGDGVEVYQEQLKTLMKVPYSFAPLHLSKQRAGAIGALGVIYFKKGLGEDADLHQPTYLRLSQAERELAEKQQSNKCEQKF